MSYRIVFLPPFPINAFDYQSFEAVFRRTSLERLKKLVEYACNKERCEFVSYIRHEATVKLLSDYLGVQLKPSSDLYKYSSGDVIVLIGLKRPVRGSEVTDLKPDDLDIILVDVFDVRIRRTLLEERAYRECIFKCYEPRKEEIRAKVPADHWVNYMSKAFADCARECERELG